MQWQTRDSQAAELYEQYQVPATFEPWAAELVRRADLRPGQDILDVACGTGIVVRTISKVLPNMGRLVGLDFNAGMLAVARSIAPSIEFHQASAEAMPFGDGEFDVVLCQFGLMFMPEPVAVLREMHRILRPAGRLALSIWGPIDQNPFQIALATAFKKHFPQEVAEKLNAGMSKTYGTLTPEQLQALIVSADFNVDDCEPVELLIRAASPEAAVRAYLRGSALSSEAAEQAGEHVRARIVEDVVRVLRPCIDSAGLSLPRLAIVATARRN